MSLAIGMWFILLDKNSLGNVLKLEVQVHIDVTSISQLRVLYDTIFLAHGYLWFAFE